MRKRSYRNGIVSVAGKAGESIWRTFLEIIISGTPARRGMIEPLESRRLLSTITGLSIGLVDSAYNISLAPSAGEIISNWAIDWGNGSTPGPAAGSTGSAALAFTTAADHTIAATVIDTDGAAHAATLTTALLTAPNTSTLPTAPTALTAKAVSAHEVDLTWQETGTNQTGFVVERSLPGAAYGNITTLGNSATAYADIGVVDGSAYSYQIVAFNSSGAATSASASAITPLPAPVATATPAANDSNVVVTWASTATQAGIFEIDRSNDGITYLPITTVAANVFTYTDTGLAAGATYHYQVIALNSLTRSAASVAASATTSTFQVFDTMLFANQPNLTSYGITEGVYIAYGDLQNTDTTPNQADARAQADDAVADHDSILIIDQEDWGTDATGISNFQQVVGWMHSEQPTLKLGIFDIAPALTGNATLDAPMLTLARSVNYLCPELYTETADGTQWTSAAINVLTQAAAVGNAAGTPIDPFLYMSYDCFAPAAYTALPQAYWQEELAVVRRNANGVFLWGDDCRKNSLGQPLTVNDWTTDIQTAPWWQSTLAFLQTLAPDHAVLVAPGNVSATSNLGNVTLTWTNTSTSGDGITIQRSTDGINFNALAMAPHGAISYVDSALHGGPYYYRLCASTWLADSAPSAVVSATELQDATSAFQAMNCNQASTGISRLPEQCVVVNPGGCLVFGGVDFIGNITTFTISLDVASSLNLSQSNAGPIQIYLGNPQTNGQQIAAFTDYANTVSDSTNYVTQGVRLLPGVSVTPGAYSVYIVFGNMTVVKSIQFSITPAWLASTSTALWSPGTQTLTVIGNATLMADPGKFGDAPSISNVSNAGIASNLLVDTRLADGGDGDALVHLAAISGNGATTVNGTNLLVAGNFTQTALVNNGNVAINGAGAIGQLTGAGNLTVGNGASANTVQLLAAVTPDSFNNTQHSITISPGATLDITNNTLLLNYGNGSTPLAVVQAAVKCGAGVAGASGAAGAIISSTANAGQNEQFTVGYADATELGSITAGNVKVMYTFVGDARLDGTPNFSVFSVIQNNYGQSGRDWSQGDFNHDGVVNFVDYSLLQNTYNQSIAGLISQAVVMGGIKASTTPAASSAVVSAHQLDSPVIPGNLLAVDPNENDSNAAANSQTQQEITE